jgi:geranylgeranylglycerol-phosphate geranylgeranyltransferase
MRFTAAIISLLRPHNVLAAFLAVAAGYSMGGGAHYPWMLLAAVSIAAGAGNVINDYYDREIDRVNKPGRPIPSGSIGPKTALLLYIVLLALLTASLFLLSGVQIIWLSSWVVMLHIYSMILKRKLLAGNLAVSILTSSGFVLGAYSAGNIEAGVIPAIYTFFFIMAREIVKDCEDIDGDYIFGAETLAVATGEEKAMKAAAVIFLLLTLAFPVPYIAGVYGGTYLVIILIGVVPITLISSYLAFRNRRAGLISQILKIGIFSGIIGFYFAY